MPTHRIDIPQWIPARLNQLKDNRWVSGKLKKRDREIVAAYAPMFGVPAPTGRRKVSLRVVLPKGQRAPDGDAYWKSLLDALVKAEVLIDDNRNGCLMGEVEFVRSRDHNCSTTIILEDVEPAAKIRRLKKGEVA